MPAVHELHTDADFEQLLAASYERPVVLLKHSTACAISARGRRAFLALDREDDPPRYLLIVQQARALSRHIAERLGVRHETPQVLVIHEGEAVFHASHFRVNTEAVREAAHAAATS